MIISAREKGKHWQEMLQRSLLFTSAREKGKHWREMLQKCRDAWKAAQPSARARRAGSAGSPARLQEMLHRSLSKRCSRSMQLEWQVYIAMLSTCNWHWVAGVYCFAKYLQMRNAIAAGDGGTY